ncbi:MAG TPA: EscU/YscU/HrcU family type III secretion system export apparatus switch protein [Bryobacteraceae bacterium]|nr:EscU/YscU/HrcU family type III secretion system export apparatus switch protein [Bryobacteraceae bacterium]
MSDRGERTEQPTQKRVEKTRKDGRFPVSRELNGAAQFLAFALIVSAGAASWLGSFGDSVRAMIKQAFRIEVTPAALTLFLRETAQRDLAPLVAAGACVAAAGAAAHFGSTRLGFSLENLSPKFSRMNPLTRLTELPKQNLPQLIQAFILIPIFGIALWAVIADNLDAIRMLPLEPVQEGARQLGAVLLSLINKAAVVFLVFGVLDFYRQRRRWMKDMRMTKQEIREEAKEGEVSPQVKGRIRRLQREYTRKRMMNDVPTATAIVVNPTHFAVAIRYIVESMPAPMVVAKGRNALALRIRMLATEHNVPIVENPPLAQALYKYCNVGQEIPAHLYRAVAEILAYLIRLNGGRSRA